MTIDWNEVPFVGNPSRIVDLLVVYPVPMAWAIEMYAGVENLQSLYRLLHRHRHHHRRRRHLFLLNVAVAVCTCLSLPLPCLVATWLCVCVCVSSQ